MVDTTGCRRAGTLGWRGLVAALLVAVASPAAAAAPSPAGPRQFGLPALPRADFNRLAVRANSPLFWSGDRDNDGQIDPDELAAVGYGNLISRFVKRGKFTPLFVKAYRALVELRRQQAVRHELDGGRPSLVQSDFRRSTAADRRMVAEVVAAARLVDQLYYRQVGAARLQRRIPRSNAAAQALFARNNGPWCRTPKMVNDPFCNALPDFPRRLSETYPADLAGDPRLCKMLSEHPNAKALLDPYTAVRRRGKQLVAVPLTEAYPAQMRQVAARLEHAARALAGVESEAAFVKYLRAAARAFTTNDWDTADEAWAAMSSRNSRWYLRVAPDEVYEDPCQQKGGFHVSFATIDQASLGWQKRLNPLRQRMEQALASHIGPAYRARDVKFQMPDFIRIILNAGDSRSPLGATIGQSLPNWGRVPREGRGRTVVMTNLYNDPDSLRVARLQARALLDNATFGYFTSDPKPFLVNTILHEATHNFGPHSDHLIGGKAPKEIFGGGLASTMEELKAQTGALWYLPFLRERAQLSWSDVKRSYTRATVWAFSHASRGMVTPDGHVRPYSQLAAIQLGALSDAGALTFARGKFHIDFSKMKRAIDALMQTVGGIKAKGDLAGAQKLVARYTTDAALARINIEHIRREMLRYPKATFRYAVLY